MVDILIADDHALIREGLKKILRNGNVLQVVAEACNAVEMMKKLEKTKVDVIVLDISMPGMSGLEAIKEIKRFHPKIPILILSIHPEERFALRAIKAGASGYITKHCVQALCSG
jgi:two-component system, NarL family, invasion response regulator UvrY